MEEIQLTTPDKFTLDSTYNAGSSDAGVVFAHGATVSKEKEPPFVRAAEALAKLGVHTLAFDFRGHGESSGDSAMDPSIEGELTDLSTAVEFLRNKGVKKIGIAGASFGASIASLYARRNEGQVSALLLSNPVLNYTTAFFAPTTEPSRQFFGYALNVLETEPFVVLPWSGFRMGRRIFDDMKHYDPIQALQTYTGPLLVVHGDADTDISFVDCERYYKELTNPKKRFVAIHGGKHAFREEPHTTKVTEEIISFFSKELGVE